MTERTPRKRSRAGAKQAGARFERQIADYLNFAIGAITGFTPGIDRRVKTGAKDRGDIGNVRRLATPNSAGGYNVVVECKSTVAASLATWMAEAEVERVNDDALVGVVVHKRHGRSDPAEQWVTMTVRELVALLTGERPASPATESGPDDSEDEEL